MADHNNFLDDKDVVSFRDKTFDFETTMKVIDINPKMVKGLL